MDRWLWSVRVYKTRSEATEACRSGHIRVNEISAKPATPIRVGDQVDAWAHGRRISLEVVKVIDKRVGPAAAAECVVDHSPPPPPAHLSSPFLVREPAAGRPTKKERRQLDRFRLQ